MKKYIFIILLLCGASVCEASLQDIQTAVICQDFTSAQQFAEELLAKEEVEEKDKYLAQYYLGLSLTQVGDHEKSEKIFMELLEEEQLTERLRIKVYLGLMDVYYFQEKYMEELDVAAEILEDFPESDFKSLVYFKKARAHLKLADWNEAKNFLNLVVTDYSNSSELDYAKHLLQEKQYFAVQVGSFSDREHAEELAEELRQKGQYSYIIESEGRHNVTYFRVRVGQLSRLNEANELKEKLASLGYPTRIYP